MTNKVFIGLPLHESVDPQFWLSSLKLVRETGLGNLDGAILPLIGDSAIQRSRNQLTKRFLDSDCTHLLFIDSDLVFSTDQIHRILNHKEEVVGGIYVKKQEGPPQLVINTCLQPKPIREDGLMEVRYVGTGFIRVARVVFERMLAAWEEQIWYNADDSGEKQWDFWHMGVYEYPDGKRRFLTEDWWFCQKCLDLGIKVWADMRCVLRHSAGMVTFPLTYQEEQLYGKRISQSGGSQVNGLRENSAGTSPEAPSLQVPALI